MKSPRMFFLFALSLFVALAAACGEDRAAPDGGSQADAFDDGGDAASDAGLDGEVDAGSDAGDAGADGGGDLAFDAGADAGADAGTDGDGEDGSQAQGDDGGADDGGTGGDWMPPELSRAQQWVRDNPMFISGLTVQMGDPPDAFVNDYFDNFHANAVHLWQTGLPNTMNGWADAGRSDFRFVAWTRDDGTSVDGGELLGGYPADAPGRIAYQIGDEPANLQDMYALEEGFEAIRAHDPEALLILNFSFSVDNIEEILDYYVDQMDGDIVSYDLYSRSSGVYRILGMFREAALRGKMPYWRYMNSYLAADLEQRHHESDQRWDAFSGLVYGYTGHSWFIYQITSNHDLYPILFETGDAFDATKTSAWALHAQINQEMANLGRAITVLTSTEIRYVPTLSWFPPEGTVIWEPGAGGDPYITALEPAPDQLALEILVGFFRDDYGEFYTMVQNVRHEHGEFPINNDEEGSIRIVFDFSGAPAGLDRSAVLSLNKLTGQVEVVPMSQVQGDVATLDIVLAAGDPFLFKYITGQAFALQP